MMAMKRVRFGEGWKDGIQGPGINMNGKKNSLSGTGDVILRMLSATSNRTSLFPQFKVI